MKIGFNNKGIMMGFTTEVVAPLEEGLTWIDCPAGFDPLSQVGKLVNGSLEVITDQEHEGLVGGEDYIIYDYVPKSKIKNRNRNSFPGDIDFKTCSKSWTPYKVTYPLLQGEPTHVIYYEDSTKTTPVCRRDFEITRYDKNTPGEEALHGFIKQKKDKLSYYKKDGSVSTIYKDIGQLYLYPDDIGKMLDEGVQKRGLIYKNLKANVLGMLQSTLGVNGANTHTPDEAKAVGVQYISDEKAGFDNYVDAYNTTIISNITNDTTHTWLDNVINTNGVTIRQYMIGELDLG